MSKEKSLCSKRVEWIDIAKAIGVFCVVAGHTGLPIPVSYTHLDVYKRQVIWFRAERLRLARTALSGVIQ